MQIKSDSHDLACVLHKPTNKFTMDSALIILTFLLGVVLLFLLPDHEDNAGWVLEVDPDIGRDLYPLEFD